MDQRRQQQRKACFLTARELAHFGLGLIGAKAEAIEGLTAKLTVTVKSNGEDHTLKFYEDAEGMPFVHSDYLRGAAQLKKSDAAELLAEAEELFQE